VLFAGFSTEYNSDCHITLLVKRYRYLTQADQRYRIISMLAKPYRQTNGAEDKIIVNQK
jgi:hypothetical protein